MKHGLRAERRTGPAAPDGQGLRGSRAAARTRREWDEKQEFPREVFTKLGELGLTGVCHPAEYGGAELSMLDWAIVMEELARVDAGVALSLAAHHSLSAAHIGLAGNDEQKRRFLTPLAKGEKVGCWGLTEPGSGSDAGGMRTTAVRDGDHWLLNGSKNFITNGGVADIAVVMTVTDRAKGKKGISAIVVERGTPGFRSGKKEDKLGVRSSDTSELVFEDCRVPLEQPDRPGGHGLRRHPEDPRPRPHRHRRLLDRHRAGRARGLDALRARPQAVRPPDRRLPGDPDQDRGDGDEGRRLAAAGLARRRTLADCGKNHTAESSMAKLFAGEAAVEVALEAIQIHGGYGYIKEYPVERYLRDAKLGTIGEGTSEVQRMVIARQLLHLRPVVR